MILKPEILTHPNIPKPLHGLNPRSIKGKQWWDMNRQAVYKSTDYHCIACGVHKSKAKGHQWLECHEYWNIMYEIGVCEVIALIPLCNYCHCFIHSGRLYATAGGETPMSVALEKLKHGFEILIQNKLPAFYGTVQVARELGLAIDIDTWEPPEAPEIGWSDWVLMFEGKEYRSKFEDYYAWAAFYNQ